MKKLFTLLITKLILYLCCCLAPLNAATAVPPIDLSGLHRAQQQQPPDRAIYGSELTFEEFYETGEFLGTFDDDTYDEPGTNFDEEKQGEEQQSERSSYYEPTPNDLLIQAVQQNNLLEVKRLLSPFQADPSCYLTATQQTPLHIAVQNRNFPFVQIIIALLNHGADPDAQDIDGNTALHIAMKLQNIPAVTILLKRGANPNKTNRLEQTALDIARNHPQTVKVKPRYVDKRMRETALHQAAKNKNSRDVINALLNLGLDPNAQNVLKQTPLHIAAAHGNYDAVEALLNGNADPTIVDKSRRTPMLVAKTLEIFKLLERAQALWLNQ